MPSPVRHKSEKVFQAAEAPHLGSGFFTPKIFWLTTAALTPIILGSVVFFGWNGLRIYSVAAVSAILFEFTFQKIFRRPNRVLDGSSFLFAIFFSFLLPPQTPSLIVVLGVLFMIVLAKELFGGLGQYIFHPALVSFVLLLHFFPGQFVFPEINEQGIRPFFLSANNQMLGAKSPALIAVCGIYLIFRRKIDWAVPVFYLAGLWIGFQAVGSSVNPLFSNGIFFLLAFFFLTEHVTSPVTRPGKIYFAMLTSLLSVSLSFWLYSEQAAVISVLIANAIVPLMDRFVMPDYS